MLIVIPEHPIKPVIPRFAMFGIWAVQNASRLPETKGLRLRPWPIQPWASPIGLSALSIDGMHTAWRWLAKTTAMLGDVKSYISRGVCSTCLGFRIIGASQNLFLQARNCSLINKVQVSRRHRA